MRAVFIESHGGPEVLQYGQRPEPTMADDEVKVRVKASALNRLDTYVRTGLRGQRRQFPPPLILGGDSAGEVVEVGARVPEESSGPKSCNQPPNIMPDLLLLPFRG